MTLVCKWDDLLYFMGWEMSLGGCFDKINHRDGMEDFCGFLYVYCEHVYPMHHVFSVCGAVLKTFVYDFGFHIGVCA
jgi:hypothetical protein